MRTQVQRVFIDGQAGTTGLEMAARLKSRCDIELLELGDSERKDPRARKTRLNAADAVVLCLPDDAAREAVTLLENPATKVLDASTAHRVAPGWVYGLPELDANRRAAIRTAQRVSNPGCYPTGFLLAVRPVIDAGLLDPARSLTVHAVSGYSGGGRAMIEAYQRAEADGVAGVQPTKTYGLSLSHKHVPEMQRYSGTATLPLFTPSVGHYYKGMLVHVPLPNAWLERGASSADVHQALEARYADEPCVDVLPLGAANALEGGYLSPTAVNDTNRIELMVFGNEAQTLLIARLDNLGKGASGAAVQNLNLMLGIDELQGLAL